MSVFKWIEGFVQTTDQPVARVCNTAIDDHDKVVLHSVHASNLARWVAGISLVALLAPYTAMGAETPVDLGDASSFAALAATTVTIANGGAVNGDLGVWPGSSVVGIPPAVVRGTIYATTPEAEAAQAALTVAYNDAAGRSTAPVTVAGNLGGQTLPPGLYKSTSSLEISSGELTLDAQGDENAVFIFQIASTLVTTSGRQVILAGNAQVKNIFWQVGSSATLGSGSVFKGTILAQVSITAESGASLDGRALARTGAVTMDGNTVSDPLFLGVIESVTPNHGSTDGGYPVTIVGTNLSYSNDITGVTLCGVTAIIVSQDGGTQVVVTAGSSPMGLGDVRIQSTVRGETLRANAFTYETPGFSLLSTSGAWIGSGSVAATNNGTDFGPVVANYRTITNVFTLTNSGNISLTVSNVTTNGSASFSLPGSGFMLPLIVPAGGVADVPVIFEPQALGAHTTSFTFEFDGADSPYILNVAGEGSSGGSMRMSTNVLNFTATYGGANPASQINPMFSQAASDFAWTSTLVYSPGASGWLDVWPDSGIVVYSSDAVFLSNKVNSAGLSVGTYYATNRISSDEITNSPIIYVVTLVVTKANQIVLIPVIPRQDPTNTYQLVGTASSGLPLVFSVESGPGVMGGSSTVSFTSRGTVEVKAVQSGNSNWNPAYTTRFISVYSGATYLDFDGDSSADIAVYQPENGTWSIWQSMNDTARYQAWGWDGAVPVPGDYDGDGSYDVAVYAAETGQWCIWQSASQTARIQSWGWSEAEPVPGDYDGDGYSDVAVYSPESGTWFIWQSATQTARTQAWGWSEAVPVPADYDGDGLCDLAVYYPESGTWYIWQSGTQTARIQAWGWNETEPVPGDYDGDGEIDIAVYYPESGSWFIWQSATQTARTQLWGWNQAWPVPADYDGDGIYDHTVYVPSYGGQWYTWLTGSSTPHYQPWGWEQAIPVNP